MLYLYTVCKLGGTSKNTFQMYSEYAFELYNELIVFKTRIRKILVKSIFKYEYLLKVFRVLSEFIFLFVQLFNVIKFLLDLRDKNTVYSMLLYTI